MSVATERGSKGVPNFLTNTLPQVNLLPPEVRAARGLAITKKWLAGVLALVLVIAGLGYGVAVMMRQSADYEEAAAQQDAALLKTDEARYAEVPIVVNELARRENARMLAMSTEILWRGYLDAITAVLPANVSIKSFTVTQGSASTAPPAPPDALAAQGVATILFSSNAATLPDDANWLDALDSIPGFYAATFTSAALGGESGTSSYTVSSSVQVDLTSYSGRFSATKGN